MQPEEKKEGLKEGEKEGLKEERKERRKERRKKGRKARSPANRSAKKIAKKLAQKVKISEKAREQNKLTFFGRVTDFQVLAANLSDLYKEPWAYSINAIEVYAGKHEFIQQIEIGDSFTCAGTDENSIYSWGKPTCG